MTNLLEVYKCMVCGNIVKVVHASEGTLVCCGQPMALQQEKTADQGKEKHVPVVEKTANGILVKIGAVPHPMEEKHYIEWVEVRDGREGLHPVFQTRGKARSGIPGHKYRCKSQGILFGPRSLDQQA